MTFGSGSGAPVGVGGEEIRRWIEPVVREAADFLVDTENGAGVGVVEEVLVDADGAVAQIVVCSGWFGRRRRTFALQDVVSVSPSRRLLVVSEASAARAEPDARESRR